MYVGYARVSTQDQHLDLQQHALQQAGCTRIIVDRVSGTVAERPGLAKLKEILRADDTLVVWRLDRLGRSLKDLIAWVAWLEQEGIGLRSLHEALDTTTPSGKLTFHIFGALAEFERQLIQERTQAGLRVARARGRLGGRPKALPADKRQLAVQLYQEKKIAVKQVCEVMGISKPTLYAYVRQAQSASQRDATRHATKGHRMPKKSREQKRADKTRARAKKRQQRHARPSFPASMPSLGGLPFGPVPDAPPGFRALPMMQAMLEFAAPLMACVEQGTVQDPNDALHIAMQLWNVTLPTVPVVQQSSRTAIVDTIQTTLQLDRQEAEAFFERMIARKAHLFPDDIQPAGSMTMFMRKEVEYLITPFAESQLHLSDDLVPPDRDDETFLEALRQLEARIDAGEDYGDWEADFFAMQERCCQRYRHWLRAKGVPETVSQQFAFCLEPYLTFLYQYDGGKVQDIWPDALEEFFMDWLMRKVMVKPPEYTQWPPALRLFYRFLSEKGYLNNPESIIAGLQAIEPDFIALVKQRS